MAERGIIVDHPTLHRWVIRLVPLLDKGFRRHKRSWLGISIVSRSLPDHEHSARVGTILSSTLTR